MNHFRHFLEVECNETIFCEESSDRDYAIVSVSRVKRETIQKLVFE